MTPRDRRVALGIAGLLLGTYAYFHHAGGWNENSRFDLVRALVDDHTLSIDRYHRNTGDKALRDGHYYSDKAPGLSFLAAPGYALLTLLRGAFRSEHDFVVTALAVVTVLTVGVAGAATGALVYRSSRALGASPRGALVGALGLGLGTLAFPFSTMLFGHQLAACLLFGAAALALDRRRESTRGRSAAVLALSAVSVLVEYPAAPAALLIVATELSARRPSMRRALAVLAGAVPIALLAAYLTAAFGGPLRVGYAALADPSARDEMLSRGLFGLTFPRPQVLLQLLLGPDRGLLVYSPVLLLALPGYGALLDDGEGDRALRRRALLLLAGVPTYFLLFVSSYEWWQGGAAFGSRHLVPMLPFVAVPVALAASRRPAIGATLAAVSAATMLVVTSVQPKPAERWARPFTEYLLPAFLRGELADSKACPDIGSSQFKGHVALLRGRAQDAMNLGMLVGARGPRSLAPLIALWLAAAWSLGRATRTLSPEAGEPRSDAT